MFDSLETSTHSSSPDSDYITATSPSLLTEPTTTLSITASSTKFSKKTEKPINANSSKIPLSNRYFLRNIDRITNNENKNKILSVYKSFSVSTYNFFKINTSFMFKLNLMINLYEYI